MKPLSWKKSTVIISFAILVGLTWWYVNRSESVRQQALSTDPAFSQYISAYTTGVISATSPLRIVFAYPVVDSARVGQPADKKLFKFTPSIAGQAVWRDRRTIEFQPDNRLPSGNAYVAEFSLKRVVKNIAAPLETFRYAFRTMPQSYEIEIVSMHTYSPASPERQRIEGSLVTADYSDAKQVERVLKAVQKGKFLSVTWTHGGDGLKHDFVVENVVRENVKDSVTLHVDGSPIGVDQTEQLQVYVPRLGEFLLTAVRVVQSPEQYVVLQFSDPIRENQNLKGFITIEGLPDLDFAIYGNEIRVYPRVRQNGSRALTVAPGIRTVAGKRFETTLKQTITFEQIKPAVRFAGKGSILPGTEGLVLPFEAVNLNAVDVQVIRVYEDNVLQFFQVNNLGGNQQLRRVGNRILQKKISLEESGNLDPGRWNRHVLDISKLIEPEPGAIYQIRLSFKKSYSTFGCPGQSAPSDESLSFDVPLDDSFEDGYAYDSYGQYYYPPNYDWRERDNPCHDSYYTGSRNVYRNVLASDIGLIVKQGTSGQTIAFVSDLKTAQPVPGAEVSLFSYQLRPLESARTDQQGTAILHPQETPFAVVVKHGLQRAYLRLVNGEALNLASFDVSGQDVRKGLKGFLYGERGVWRPGDSLHINFILYDEEKRLPDHHPVVFEMIDPHGLVVHRQVRSSSQNGFYRFATATRADAPTGNWLGRVRAGGAEFTQTLKIETVKPNRLKIDLDFGVDKLTSPELRGRLAVRWLHGAPARSLRAEYEVLLSRQKTTFEDFPDYNFDDPSRRFNGEVQPLFEGRTNEQGEATVQGKLEQTGKPSGVLQAVFRGKVFEESGNFSIDRFSVPFHPYSSYVGLRLPQGEPYSGLLYTNTDHQVHVASVDIDGRPVSRKTVDIKLYKLTWRWWWDNSFESLANFVEDSYSTLVREGTVSTHQGKGTWKFNLSDAEYGRYFLRACDRVSGHCAGEIVYVDEPGWYSRARADDARGGISLLAFTTDKSKYRIGEQVRVTVPAPDKGRALISIESGSRIVESFWSDTQQGDNEISFETTSEMTPNVYVHVSLIQPHAQTVNDLPVRLYGVSSIQVEDPGTRLYPEIVVPDALVAGETVTVRVSERDGKPMTYTLAVVDEGLLDLTRFKTPDPWATFYAREALGVRTWDVYDDVMGAFGARLERFIAIGGDDEIRPVEMDPVANRFKPVVQVFGPYTLESGIGEVKFTMPEYIGSVRTMVVAGNGTAFGQAEKSSVVTKPIMVLATLPRVLGPGEKVRLPVTVFAGDKPLNNVAVSVKTTGGVSVKDAQQKVSLARNTDKTVEFLLEVHERTGSATVEVVASQGNIRARDVTDIQVRNPNLPATKIDAFVIEGNERKSTTVVPFGLAGTNSAVLEVSALPPLNLTSRMGWLLQYPHGCLEQITSIAFPQVHLDQLMELSDKEKETVRKNVMAGIENVQRYAHADGGFGYWPGTSEPADSWSTSYVGHFLSVAEQKGYYVPAELLTRWKTFQRSRANNWRSSGKRRNEDLLQAYRLYTLALAGAPELGAMNRLRESDNRSTMASWMLAAAYAASGQPEAAQSLINNAPREIKSYRELDYTYGSDLRDRALILETLTLLGKREMAFEVLNEVSAALSDPGRWLSTQETSMALRAVAMYAGKESRQGELKFEYALARDKPVSVSTGLAVSRIDLSSADAERSLSISNKTRHLLYARVATTGTPMRGSEAGSRALDASVRYTDTKGNPIDVSSVEQGTQLIAEVTVRHPGLRGNYQNLALTQVFPSGWEIDNLRLHDAENFLENSTFRYQDIRDDRVMTYFDLNAGESKTFRVMITAAYSGEYYLPGVSCEAMYDGSIYARTAGRSVKIVSQILK